MSAGNAGARVAAPASRPPELLSDYGGFGFEQSWQRRHRTTLLESAILDCALEPCDRRRVLEIGAGFGRLSGPIRRTAVELVALDFNETALRQLRRSGATTDTKDRPSLLVEGNAYHLPFVEGAFTCAVVLRLHHHLSTPEVMFGEIARTLASGGNLVLSYAPKPTLGTLIEDLRRSLRNGPERHRFWLSFSREAVAELPAEPFPIFVPTDREALRQVNSAGFRILTRLGTTPEVFHRYLPLQLLTRAARLFPDSAAFSMRFATGQRDGTRVETLATLEEVIACPRCRMPQRHVEFFKPWESRCPRCDFRMSFDGEILHAKYIPPEAHVYRSGVHLRKNGSSAPS